MAVDVSTCDDDGAAATATSALEQMKSHTWLILDSDLEAKITEAMQQRDECSSTLYLMRSVSTYWMGSAGEPPDE